MTRGSSKVVFAVDSVAELHAVPFPFRRQINQRIHKLKSEPRPPGVRNVDEGVYLLRLERWGLLYEVDEEAQLVTVLAVHELDISD